MKEIVKKTRTHNILDAVMLLNEAMEEEEPHIRIISVGYGFGLHSELATKEFGLAIKNFVKAYKKYYGLKKVNLELAVR